MSGMLSHDQGRTPVPDGAVVRDFAEFHAHTYAYARRTARRAASGDVSIADDAVQDAYASMLANWTERRDRSLGDNRAYLLRIVFNKVMDHHRQSGRFAELQSDHEICGEDPGFSTVLDSSSLMRSVREFLDSQPPRRRAVAMLRFLGDYEYSEIAQILGISESTVRTQVERVRVLLKPYVDQMMRIEKEASGRDGAE
jgi:RNA polymerase sigma-70 factor (ECF subfamily)